MALSQLGRRVQWLFPPEVEVYRTSRVTALSGAVGDCVRCGQAITLGAHGLRQGVGVVTRQRGSKFKDTKLHWIHLGCVPTKAFETAGLPARKRRSL